MGFWVYEGVCLLISRLFQPNVLSARPPVLVMGLKSWIGVNFVYEWVRPGGWTFNGGVVRQQTGVDSLFWKGAGVASGVVLGSETETQKRVVKGVNRVFHTGEKKVGG